MRSIFASILVLLVLAAGCAFGQTPSTHVVPFDFDEITPDPVVKVKIDGGAPLSFIVDTGTAAPLVIQPWVRDQLGLKPAPGSDTSDGSVEADSIDSFALAGKDGDVRFDVSQAYVVDLSILDAMYGPHKIAGLIGIGLFSTTAAKFDFDTKTLTIYENAAPFSPPGATTVPLTIDSDGMADVDVTVAPGQTTQLPIDTGGMFTGLPSSMSASLNPRAVITRQWSGQVGGMYMCPDFLLPSLDFGGIKMPDVVVETLPEGARYTLGLNILTRYSFIIDMPHKQLVLTPRAGTGTGYGRGWSGVEFDSGSVTWRVKDVDPGSPALLAGLRVGDEITAIDGYLLAGLTNAAVFDMMEGAAGTPARLAVRRENKTLTIKFTRGDEFAAPKLPFDGLMLLKPDDGPMSVIGVQKGCPADHAGVHTGDLIDAIDGQPTGSMSLDQMHQTSADSTVHLEIKRSGVTKPLEIDLKSGLPPNPL